MKILDKTKSLSALASSTTNGLGQIQPLSCLVTEELNGIYECEFTLLTTDKYYDTLKDNGLIKIEVGDGSEQIFRVYSISEPINFVVTVKCQHISYDLSKVPVRPFTATGAVATKNQLVNHIIGSYPFTMSTDITNTTSVFNLSIPRSFRECLGGYEGSILDTFRCEYEWDNLEVKMLAHRGTDNGVRIAYGKNLTDFVQEKNNENVYDGVYGYAVVNDVTYEASSVYNKTGSSTPKILNVDFSSSYDQTTPTAADLLQKATDYAVNNSIEVPNVNIKVSFIPLFQTEEYKNILPLERVSLGDTVHVFFDKLNVEASSRVIKTVWNVLTKKYDSIELGDARANLNTVINQSVDTAVDHAMENIDIDTGYLEDELSDMSKLIINGLGLYITKEPLPSGGFRYYLHNQPTLANSDIQYYMSSTGIMVSNDYGQTWNSGFDPQTGTLIVQALSTITLRALEIYGSYIEGTQILFGDSTDKYITATVYTDASNNPLGVSFDGSGTVRIRPKTEFLAENIGASNNVLNKFQMVAADSQTSLPQIVMENYRTNGDVANRMTLRTSSNGNSFLLVNNRYGTTDVASQILMSSFDENGTFYNSFNVDLYDTSGNLHSYLRLNTNTGGTLRAGGGDFNIICGGALRISTNNSQDIVLNSADDIHISPADKLYIMGHQITLSNGYLMYT